MAGKLCTGVARNNVAGKNFRSSTAYCEGINWRAGGTLAGRPVTDNPHEAGSEANASWTAGWTLADAAAPAGVVDAADAPCCSTPTNVVVDV